MNIEIYGEHMFLDEMQKLVDKKGQRKLAESVGCSQSTISRVLTGSHIPETTVLIKLSELTEIDVSKIINEIQFNKKEGNQRSKKPRS